MTEKQFKHLIIFDSSCPLCRASVQKIINLDKKKLFCFAPLIGDTAKSILKDKYQKLLKANSLILVENFLSENNKYSLRAKGFFRVLWLIGGIYKILGVFYVLPSFLIDWIYKIIAKHRHKLLKSKPLDLLETKEKRRFLP